MLLKTKPADVFVDRHNGPDEVAVAQMLRTIGVESLDQLIDETVPAAIRLPRPLNLPAALTERAFLAKFKQIAGQNKIYKNYIGLGYHDTQLPPLSSAIFSKTPAGTPPIRPTKRKLPKVV